MTFSSQQNMKMLQESNASPYRQASFFIESMPFNIFHRFLLGFINLEEKILISIELLRIP